MHIERSSDFRRELQQLLELHAPTPVDLEFVPDVAAWSQNAGAHVPGNPTACALRRRNAAERWLIVVREHIAAEQVRSVIDGIDLFENHGERLASIDSPLRFLQHTVLHELAHLVLNVGNEQEERCNEWAFQKLAATEA